MNLYSQNIINHMGEDINYIDENNLKQGVWKIYSENEEHAPEGTVYLECKFKDGIIDGVINIKKGRKILIEITPDNDSKKASFRATMGSKEITGYIIKGNKKYDILDSSGISHTEKIRDWILQNIEFKPLFYGGTENLKNFLRKIIDLKNVNGEKGRVVVKYTVDINGYVINPVIIENDNIKTDKNYLLEQEALRIFNFFPRMQPGFQGLRFVKANFTLPISF